MELVSSAQCQHETPCRNCSQNPLPEEGKKLQDEAPFRQSKELPWIAGNWREIQGANDWQGLLEPMDNRLRAEIIRYGDFAQVCYDSFDSDQHSKYCGSCKYNMHKLFRSVGLSYCGYEVTKYLYATSKLAIPQLLRCSYSKDPWSTESNWIGFVAVSTDPKEIERLGRRDVLVCWRGTETETEWAQNLRDILITPTFQRHHNVKVERGFLSMYTSSIEGSRYNSKSSRDQVLSEIQRLLDLYKHEELSITVAGHSLGGALATLSSYDIAQAGVNIVRASSEADVVLHREGKAVPITAFTFGCPRVGNRVFRDALKHLNVKVLRVVNVNDIVPKVPGVFVNETLEIISEVLQWLPWTYNHVGVPIYVNNKHSPFLQHTTNLGYIHSMEVYLHLMDGYQSHKSGQFISHGRDHALVNKHTGLLLDELVIPEDWWQEKNKGLQKNEDGMWVQPDREEDDKPHNNTP